MVYGSYYPYIKIGLKVAECIAKSIANADEAMIKLSFWDYLKITGSCLLRYSGDLSDANKLQQKIDERDFNKS